MPKLIITSHLDDCTDTKDICVWTILQEEAAAYATREVAMSSLLHATILDPVSYTHLTLPTKA